MGTQWNNHVVLMGTTARLHEQRASSGSKQRTEAICMLPPFSHALNSRRSMSFYLLISVFCAHIILSKLELKTARLQGEPRVHARVVDAGRGVLV